MSNIRNSKNVQCAVSTGVFVGLKAEHFHASDMHATKLFSDEGVDVFDTLVSLSTRIDELQQRLDTFSLNLKDLKDVDVSNVSNGDTLVFQDNAWHAMEIENDAVDELKNNNEDKNL